ncbi:MAG: F0F1 ATP synthase subunit delta [Chloroflexota bacterium]|nr:MAG: F0F1 ATP synthase subunit delta [Chloroflexota bacterium]
MKAQELSRKYATAVFSLALESWLNPLNAVQAELTNNPTLVAGLRDKDRPFSERQHALDRIIPGDSSQQVRNFLYTLLKDGDIGLLGEVMGELERMIRGGPRVQVARVTTALPLSEQEKETFRQKLAAQYGESLAFDFDVDPALLGGAVVQVGDKVMDGSVATRLAAMSNALGVKS